MKSAGAWITFGGILAVWFSPEAAIFGGVFVFLVNLAEERFIAYKARSSSGGKSE